MTITNMHQLSTRSQSICIHMAICMIINQEIQIGRYSAPTVWLEECLAHGRDTSVGRIKTLSTSKGLLGKLSHMRITVPVCGKHSVLSHCLKKERKEESQGYLKQWRSTFTVYFFYSTTALQNKIWPVINCSSVFLNYNRSHQCCLLKWTKITPGELVPSKATAYPQSPRASFGQRKLPAP